MPAAAKKDEPVAKTTKSWVAGQEARLADRIAADLRRVRNLHRSTLEEVSEYLGHEKNWLSKIERGIRTISATEYLLVMNLIAEADHPAKILVEYFMRGGGRTLTVIK